MNYEKLYFAFVEKFKKQQIPIETYTEKHHIIPRYAGGHDGEDNLVTVSFRQHLFLHKLLWKAYRNPEDRCAVAIMGGTEDKRLAVLKLAWAKTKIWSDERRKKRSESYKRRLKESDALYNSLIEMNKKANLRKKAKSRSLWEFTLESAERNTEWLLKKSPYSKYSFVSPEGLVFDSPVYAANYYGNIAAHTIDNWSKREQHGWKRTSKQALPNEQC